MSTFIHELTSTGIGQLQGLLKPDRYIQTPEDVQNVFAIGQVISQGIDLSWRKINQLLDAGEEGRRLRFLLLEFKDVLAQAAIGLAQKGYVTGLLALAETTNRLEKIRQELQPLISWLPDSPPQVDPSSLSSAGAVEKAEGYLSLEEMLARARSGSDE
jgi:hypothetical protein